MNQTQAEAKERLIISSKSSASRGIARVQIQSIQLTHNQSRDIDKKNIKRLREIFNKVGCLRFEPKNRVAVFVKEEELQHAQGLADPGKNNKYPYPFLQFPKGALKCLHGRHRLLAASEHLDPVDQWWTVEFFVNVNESLRNHISQDFENSLNVSDGEIWRHIRICEKLGDTEGEVGWRSRLTQSKLKDIDQLSKHSGFRQAFDKLIPIPGLWVGLQLGALHRFLTLRCDEELLHYLSHIHAVWSGIFEGHQDMMEATDYATVQSLQLRAPQSSKRDSTEIKSFMESQKLLPLVHDTQTREKILQNILKTDLIPSISTFFEDLIHFEQLADAMKKLVEPIKKSAKSASVYRAFRRAFLATSGPLETQTNEGMFIITNGDLDLRMEMGYRQLWMYTMRHFPLLVSATPLKENGQPKPQPREPSLEAWFAFAELAYRLGFDSAEIQANRLENPNKKIALNFLLSVKPRESYNYDVGLLEESVEAISQILGTFRKRQTRVPVPTLTAERLPRKDVLSRRCGRPYQFDYERDKNCLFFDNFHRKYDSNQPKEDISSFFVRRAFYFAFFGNIDTPQSEAVGPEPETDTQIDIPMPSLEPDITEPEQETEINIPEPSPKPDTTELETEIPGPGIEMDIPEPSLEPESEHEAEIEMSEPLQSEASKHDIRIPELPEYVDIKIETGEITLMRDGSHELLVKMGVELWDIIKNYITIYGYRLVDTDGFLIEDHADYLDSNPKHVRLERSDIAKQGSYMKEAGSREAEERRLEEAEKEERRVRDEMEKKREEEERRIREQEARKMREERGQEAKERRRQKAIEAENRRREEKKREEEDRRIREKEEERKMMEERIIRDEIEKEREAKAVEEAERRLNEAEEIGSRLREEMEKKREEEGRRVEERFKPEPQTTLQRRVAEAARQATQVRQASRRRLSSLEEEIVQEYEEDNRLSTGEPKFSFNKMEAVKVTKEQRNGTCRATRLSEISHLLNHGYRIVDRDGSLIQDIATYLQSGPTHIRLKEI